MLSLSKRHHGRLPSSFSSHYSAAIGDSPKTPPTHPVRMRMSVSLWQAFATVFVTVFLAEIGDKTQLATMLFSAKAESSKWVVFAGSASALVLAAAIGVLVGTQLERVISPASLKIVAGIGFIAVGLWTLLAK